MNDDRPDMPEPTWLWFAYAAAVIFAAAASAVFPWGVQP